MVVSSGEAPIPVYLNFLFAGTSGLLSVCITQPAELIKTRMQLRRAEKLNLRHIVKSIKNTEGYRGFYDGLSAVFLRQVTYTTMKIGLFTSLYSLYEQKYNEKPKYWTVVTMGMAGGKAGSIISNPAEVALVRMMADGRLPPNKRRRYRNVFDAIYRIYKEEGLSTLWRGMGSAAFRAAATSGVQLSSYMEFREKLRAYLGDGPLLYIVAAKLSSTGACLVSLPFDNIKTKIQISSRKKTTTSVLKKTIKYEGVRSLWNGYLPMYLVMVPYQIVMFLGFEGMIIFYRNYYGAKRSKP